MQGRPTLKPMMHFPPFHNPTFQISPISEYLSGSMKHFPNLTLFQKNVCVCQQKFMMIDDFTVIDSKFVTFPPISAEFKYSPLFPEKNLVFPLFSTFPSLFS